MAAKDNDLMEQPLNGLATTQLRPGVQDDRSAADRSAADRSAADRSAGVAGRNRESGRHSVPPRRISVLGATGSVGTSTLDLIGSAPDSFDVVALTANSDAGQLARLAIRHRAELAVVADENSYRALKEALAGTGIEAAAGSSGLDEAALRPADCVLAAIVGAAGLAPTLQAVSQGCRIALANKECLVSAGSLFMQAVEDHGAMLLPVDSEHSAAFQAIEGSPPHSIERITLTASGGPFRTLSAAELQQVGPEAALKHPNWSMGPKITIDSATLMNKGLELIEAFHLFPVSADQLDVVVHPQSIVHCLVAFRDGSVIAQMSAPDMRVPIAYSLSWPGRMSAPTPRLDLMAIGNLSFEPPDTERFPALALARWALERGDAACTILNAANEIAVGAFLAGRIAFPRIAAIVEAVLSLSDAQGHIRTLDTLEDVFETDRAGRRLAHQLL